MNKHLCKWSSKRNSPERVVMLLNVSLLQSRSPKGFFHSTSCNLLLQSRSPKDFFHSTTCNLSQYYFFQSRLTPGTVNTAHPQDGRGLWPRQHSLANILRSLFVNGPILLFTFQREKEQFYTTETCGYHLNPVIKVTITSNETT